MLPQQVSGQPGVKRHLQLFTGFLGSGKATFIIPLVNALVKSGRRVALFVNENGIVYVHNRGLLEAISHDAATLLAQRWQGEVSHGDPISAA